MNLEIEIDGFTYQIEKLNAIQQWHVFRRLIPLLSAFSGLANVDRDAVRSSMLNQLSPAFAQLSAMSDIDTDYVLNTCLSVVKRRDQATGGWQRVMVKPGMLQFDDVEMTTMLRLAVFVVVENLSPFFTQTASADLAGAGAGATSSQ
jgi:hypothetical protein